MEEQDVFQQSGDDPFAGSEFGDFEQPGDEGPGEPPIDHVQAPTGDLPTVDREGNVVPPSVKDDIESEAAQFEGSAPATPSPQLEGGGGPAPGAEPAQPQQPAAPEPTPAPQQPAQPPAAPEPPAAAEKRSQTHEGGAGTPVPQEPPQAVAPDEAPAEPEEPEDAAPPEEPTSKSGKVTKRRYVILRVDGPDKFTQVHWYEDSDGKLTQKGGGAKRQKVVLARGTEDALKFGFAAVGAPQDGATLIAVAAAYFQPKKIKPMPPEPSRQRLQIS